MLDAPSWSLLPFVCDSSSLMEGRKYQEKPMPEEALMKMGRLGHAPPLCPSAYVVSAARPFQKGRSGSQLIRAPLAV